MWRSLHNSMPRLRGSLKPHLLGIAQSTSAQAFNLLGILAGSILAESYGVLSQYSWALLVFPGLLSNRGAIGGLFSGRLSTGLHLGTILPAIRGNTEDAYQLFSSVVTLTALSALLLTIGGGLFSVISYGVGFWEFYRIFLVIFTTLALSILVIPPTTFMVSIQAYNRGLDPDMVVYPITSTTADVSISFIYVAILGLITLDHWLVNLGILLVIIGFICGALWLHVKNSGKKEYDKTLREFIGTLVVVTVIVTLTGYVLGRVSEKIGDRAAVYAIYPAMIDTVGDVGSIIGSTATTKLSLGYFKAEFSSIRDHMNEISYAWSGSLILFTVYAVLSGVMYGFSDFSSLLSVVLWTNLLTIPLIILISFGVGITTFKRGLDPDNFVIPFETSLADSLTTIALYLMILVWFR
jgi:mgtE-like transporter